MAADSDILFAQRPAANEAAIQPTTSAIDTCRVCYSMDTKTREIPLNLESVKVATTKNIFASSCLLFFFL